MIGILSLFIHLKKYSNSQEKYIIYKYRPFFVLINQCTTCFALITLIIEEYEYRAMKAIVIQNIKLQTILIMHKLYTSKEDCSDVIFNEDYSYSSVLVFNA